MNRQNFGAFGALGIGVLILIAVLLIVFKVNPQAQTNRIEIAAQRGKLHRIICAQAQTTANAYRVRSLTPSGEIESIRHFLTRLQAQQQTLELSRGLGCMSNPGFPPFKIQINRALKEIREILSRYTAEQKEPIELPYETATPQLSPAIKEVIADPTLVEPEPGVVGVGGGEVKGPPPPKEAPPPIQIPREPPPMPVLEEPPALEEAQPLVPPLAEALPPTCSVVRALVDLC